MGKSIKDYKLNYENLIDMFPSALYVIRDSVIIDCNAAAVKVFGYKTKQELLGLKPYELSPEKQPDGSLSIKKGEQIISKALNSDKEIAFRWMHKRKNGDVFLANVKIFNKNGNLYAVMIDINEIEKLKHYLGEKDYLYHMLFENNSAIMLLVDPDTGHILEANQAAVQYYGYDKNKLLTMNVKEINILNHEQIEQEMLKAKSEQTSYFEFVQQLANGEHRRVEVYTFPVELYGNILLFFIINDVSDILHKELMFNTLFLNSPYAVAILDKEQKIVNINKNFTYLFQYQLDEVKGKYISRLLSLPNNKSQIDKNIQSIYQGKIIRQEGKRRRKDGKLIDVEIFAYPVVRRQSIIGSYVIYNDISQKKNYQRQLLLFRKILENNSEGVLITDINGNIEWVNNAFQQITGYSLTEIKGKNVSILKSGIQDQAFYKDMWERLNNEGKWGGEIWNKTKKGEIYCEWLTINSIKDDSNKTTHYVGILKDLAEKEKIDKRMADLKQKDSLTGLYNRNYFLGLVNTYINNCKKNERFPIIFIDIENFKEINNSLGHHVGDKVLVELSKRLLYVTNNNYVLSRYSGDEFVILCKFSVTTDQVRNIAQQLLKKIRQPFTVGNTILNVTVNIGISWFPDNGKDAETLIRHADTAVCKAKEQLEEKIFFYSEGMSKEVEQRFLLANQLIEAIRNNEFTLNYQPIFNINNPGNIVGIEALLRWENSVLGKVFPDKFIPVAEKTGQIIYIGEWVLRQVCKQINIWHRKGYNIVPVAVNISVKQLEQAEFARKVVDIIQEHSVDPNNIELEITESISSGDLSTILKNLKELKRNGIKVSMDDFGTGFSSLGQLALFELDKLKIDKIFIDDLSSVSKRQNIVKSIIAMAKNLGLTVVAEGIETNEQLCCLKKLGCQLGQGYFFCKPLPAGEIEDLFYTSKIRVKSQ